MNTFIVLYKNFTFHFFIHIGSRSFLLELFLKLPSRSMPIYSNHNSLFILWRQVSWTSKPLSSQTSLKEMEIQMLGVHVMEPGVLNIPVLPDFNSRLRRLLDTKIKNVQVNLTYPFPLLSFENSTYFVEKCSLWLLFCLVVTPD